MAHTSRIYRKLSKKRNEISIKGKLATRNYTGKKGIKRCVTEIMVNGILMLGGKNNLVNS
ncbi:MAG: single-stranded DNA-binding protein [Janthinobacterium lividum]